MTLQQALLVTRKRQLRPDRYGKVNSFITTFLLLVVCIRYCTNIYLACFLCPVDSSASILTARFFLRINLAFCALWLSTLIPLMSYRGMAHGITGRRLHFFPLTRLQRQCTTLHVGLCSILVYGSLSLGFLAWALSPFRSNWATLSDLVLFLFLGLFGAGFILLFCLYLEPRDTNLVFLETSLLFSFFLANPDFRLTDGKGLLLLFNRFPVQQETGLIFILVPIAGSLVLVFCLLVACFFEKLPKYRTVTLSFDLALYWRRLPKTVFSLFLILELVLIFTHPDTGKTVRDLVLFFLLFRLIYFVQYAVNLENQIVNRLAAPASGSRLRIYGRAALAHSTFCILPLLCYVLRLI